MIRFRSCWISFLPLLAIMVVATYAATTQDVFNDFTICGTTQYEKQSDSGDINKRFDGGERIPVGAAPFVGIFYRSWQGITLISKRWAITTARWGHGEPAAFFGINDLKPPRNYYGKKYSVLRSSFEKVEKFL